MTLKLRAVSAGSNRFWNIDDIVVQGTRTASNERWWDGDGAGVVGGGSGVWDNSTTSRRWASAAGGSNYLSWQSANGDNAYFGQSGGTVTIQSATTVSARSLNFTADGYTIAAGDAASRLALTDGGSGGSGPNTIEVDGAANTAAINVSIIANPGVGVTKTGDGTLVLGRH